MNSSPATELLTFCVTCGRPVTLLYISDDGYRVQHWSCPYLLCQRPHRFAIAGTIERVARRRPATAA